MPNTINENNWNDADWFAEGLRLIISRNWDGQKQFRENGITSQVNLSRIINRKVNTSRPMRQKLAERAGVSIEEIMELGKSGSTVQTQDPMHHVDSLAPTNQLESLGNIDFLGEVSLYKRNLTAEATRWAASVGGFLSSLADAESLTGVSVWRG